METLTNTTLTPIIDMMKLQTGLFNNVTTGIADAHATVRTNGNTNHMAWLTGHLVSTRYTMAALVGLELQEPYPELFAKGKGFDENTTYPTMAELTAQWSEVSEALIAGLSQLTEEQLNGPAPFQVPFPDPTYRGVLSFFAHHEAYHIGQIGLLRKYFEYESMQYA